MTEEQCMTALAKTLLNSPAGSHLTLSAARNLIKDIVQTFKEMGYIEEEEKLPEWDGEGMSIIPPREEKVCPTPYCMLPTTHEGDCIPV